MQQQSRKALLSTQINHRTWPRTTHTSTQDQPPPFLKSGWGGDIHFVCLFRCLFVFVCTQGFLRTLTCQNVHTHTHMLGCMVMWEWWCTAIKNCHGRHEMIVSRSPSNLSVRLFQLYTFLYTIKMRQIVVPSFFSVHCRVLRVIISVCVCVWAQDSFALDAPKSVGPFGTSHCAVTINEFSTMYIPLSTIQLSS